MCAYTSSPHVQPPPFVRRLPDCLLPPRPPLLPSKTLPFFSTPERRKKEIAKRTFGVEGGEGRVLFPSLSYALANNLFPSPRKDGTVRTREGRKKEGRLQIVGGCIRALSSTPISREKRGRGRKAKFFLFFQQTFVHDSIGKNRRICNH